MLLPAGLYRSCLVKSDMLILLYNRMFHEPPQLVGLNIPANVEYTEDRGRMKEADVVVFHIPSGAGRLPAGTGSG
jgi:hypothetical protein